MDEEHTKHDEAREAIADRDKDVEWTRETSTSMLEDNKNQPVPVLGMDDIDELKSRWNAIQIEFVDEPYASVEQADELVDEVMNRISRTFAEKRADMDAQWSKNEQVSTEDLRMALQRYRSFFHQLLSV